MVFIRGFGGANGSKRPNAIRGRRHRKLIGKPKVPRLRGDRAVPDKRDAPNGSDRTWIGSIVIDCTDFARMMAFWQEALHYVPREPPEADSVVLKDPEGLLSQVTGDAADSRRPVEIDPELSAVERILHSVR